ncbi:MAG: prepilin-type N-terminal cleavage/methylation domain-containing protein [Patescibacteria group bacterium]
MMSGKNKQGFTMVELIVVVAVLLVLSAAVFSWIDPLARVGEAKNKRRIQDINLLSAALANYATAHEGVLPVLGSISTNKKVLCSVQGGSNLSCAGVSQLCLTVDDDFYKYLGALPYDPDKTSAVDTGYYLQKDASNNLIVGSCAAYNSEVITKKPNLKVSCPAYGGGYCWYAATEDTINCNQVCSNINLDCVDGAKAILDVDAGGNPFCALQKNISASYCTAGCGLSTAVGFPPMFNSQPACDVQITGPLNCEFVMDQGDSPICPCQ